VAVQILEFIFTSPISSVSSLSILTFSQKDLSLLEYSTGDRMSATPNITGVHVASSHELVDGWWQRVS
jgi:hypothetical protein